MDELANTNVLRAVKAFMTQVRGERAAERLHIKGADLVEHDTYTDGVLALWGSSTFEEGEEVIDDNGDVVAITSEQAAILTMPVYINIPIVLVRGSDASAITDYLVLSFERAKEMTEHLYEQQLKEHEQNTTGDYTNDYMYNILNQTNEPEPVPDLDMDLSEFSEEEKMLIMNSHKKNGNTIQ
jgi:hypothetical protein